MSSITYRRLLLVAVCASVSILTSCNSGVKRTPVSGTVTLDGAPLDSGLMLFHPNEAKGNTNRVSCTGPVSNGRYSLTTSGVTKNETGGGAPLGWYKVTLVTDLPGMKPIPVNRKFLRPETTPLEIEITEDPPPGAYDLKMTK
jgi:hypothetical protein